MPSLAGKASSTGLSGNAKKDGRGMLLRLWAAVRRLPIDDDETDDLAESQRPNGEIVGRAKPQHRKSDSTPRTRRGCRQLQAESRPRARNVRSSA